MGSLSPGPLSGSAAQDSFVAELSELASGPLELVGGKAAEPCKAHRCGLSGSAGLLPDHCRLPDGRPGGT
jgi:hypothetical protein